MLAFPGSLCYNSVCCDVDSVETEVATGDPGHEPKGQGVGYFVERMSSSEKLATSHCTKNHPEKSGDDVWTVCYSQTHGDEIVPVLARRDDLVSM